MTDRAAKDVGPILFNNSLRAWQARYKAQRAEASASQSQTAASASHAKTEPPAADEALHAGGVAAWER
jgi:hypothetical protein